MVEARHTMAVLADAEESMEALRRGLTRAHGAFALYLAVSNSPAVSRKLIKLLAEAVPDLELVELPADVTNPLESLREQVNFAGTGPLMVMGLEHSVPGGSHDYPSLRILNLQRGRWPEELLRPVVFWVPQYLLELLGRVAPDFLDWRSDTFHFETIERPDELSRLDGVWRHGVFEQSADDRRRRTEELQSRLASTVGTEDPHVRDVRAEWLAEIGEHLQRDTDWTRAEAYLTEAAALAQELDDRRLLRSIYSRLGFGSLMSGAANEATEWYRKALAIAENSEDRKSIAGCFSDLGTVALLQGFHDKAKRLYRRALGIQESMGDRAEVASTYAQIGQVTIQQRAYDEARDWYHKSLELWQELDDSAGVASSYYGLGRVAEAEGLLDEAVKWHQKALKINGELGRRSAMATSYDHLAMVAEERGSYDEALGYNLRSLEIDEELGNPGGMASTLLRMGIIWTKRDEVEKALPLTLRGLGLLLGRGSRVDEYNLYWLSRQSEMLGPARFRQIVETEMGAEAEPILRLVAGESLPAARISEG